MRMRNLGSSVAMITNWVFVYVIVLMTPSGKPRPLNPLARDLVLTPLSGITNIGWRYYIIFAVLNISWVPIVWYFYIETAGLSLEEIDKMFEIHYNNKGLSWKEAAARARDHLNQARVEIHEKTIMERSMSVDHSEVVVKH